VRAREAGHDVPRHELTQLRAAESRFHRVLRERPDLQQLALLRALRNGHDHAGHQMSPSSRQAERITTTETVSDQKLPSLISAMATARPESAMRARVETRARPARGASRASITFGCGFFSVKRWIAFT